jgi:hypothetical protein
MPVAEWSTLLPATCALKADSAISGAAPSGSLTVTDVGNCMRLTLTRARLRGIFYLWDLEFGQRTLDLEATPDHIARLQTKGVLDIGSCWDWKDACHNVNQSNQGASIEGFKCNWPSGLCNVAPPPGGVQLERERCVRPLSIIFIISQCNLVVRTELKEATGGCTRVLSRVSRAAGLSQGGVPHSIFVYYPVVWAIEKSHEPDSRF